MVRGVNELSEEFNNIYLCGHFEDAGLQATC